MTKLPGCKAVCDPEDFRTIQEKIASMLKLYLNQEVKINLHCTFLSNHLNPILFQLLVLSQTMYNFTSSSDQSSLMSNNSNNNKNVFQV